MFKHAYLKSAGGAASVMTVYTVFSWAAALGPTITLLWIRIVSLVVKVAIPAEPAGRVILVGQAVAIIVDSCSAKSGIRRYVRYKVRMAKASEVSEQRISLDNPLPYSNRITHKN